MGLMDRFNKGGVIFDIDINGFTFTDLATLHKNGEGEIFKIDGLYINKKGVYDNHPVAILCTEKLLVDLPSYLTETVESILQDSEVVEAIKAGKVGFSIHPYFQEKFKKDCYGINWEDIA